MLPRKQRKRYYTAPLHKKRKWIAAHLSEELLTKYNRRSAPLVKGDTVKVMRGSYKGHSDKVVGIDTKKMTISVEGVTSTKVDGTKVIKRIHPSNVLITKLNLTDRWRLSRLEEGLEEEIKKEIEKEAEEQIRVMEEELEEEPIPETKKEEPIPETKKESIKQKTVEKTNKKLDLLDIPGIGKKTAEKLKKGKVTPENIYTMNVDELAKIEGIGQKTAQKIKDELKKLEK